MTDATIVIPTYRHAALIPYSVTSALEQEGASIEVFVIGDGVEDDTRAALEPFLAEAQVRFFDYPKGEGNGDLSRHEALQEASGRIVCYLSDDDLLLRDHVAEMSRLLEDGDFAHSAPLSVMPGGSLWYGAIDIAWSEFHALLLRGGWNQIGLTGAAHTLDAYRRLPYGWRPAPPDSWSDLHMWQQFVQLEGFRGKAGTRLTHIHFPSPDRWDVSVAERVSEVESWWNRIREPGFESELERMVADSVREGALRREATIHDLSDSIHELSDAIDELKDFIGEIEGTRWWRLRVGVANSRPGRALLAHRRRAL